MIMKKINPNYNPMKDVKMSPFERRTQRKKFT